MNLLLGLLRQDGDRLTFSQIKAFDDNFAADYGTNSYLHARILLRCWKVRCSDTQPKLDTLTFPRESTSETLKSEAGFANT